LDLTAFYTVGIVLVMVGIIIIVVAILLASVFNSKKVKVRGAGVVMIGPIPIIFGTDKKSVREAVALTLALMIVGLIIYLFFWLLR
jgi:uncharacterized protein (TIGR00304 family)